MANATERTVDPVTGFAVGDDVLSSGRPAKIVDPNFAGKGTVKVQYGDGAKEEEVVQRFFLQKPPAKGASAPSAPAKDGS